MPTHALEERKIFKFNAYIMLKFNFQFCKNTSRSQKELKISIGKQQQILMFKR